MTEFWVSKKQYWCKYCDTYIRDDAPSRRQHENGLRHQGNKERFVRNIYKQGEKAKKDAEEEKREMTRIEQARPMLSLRYLDLMVYSQAAQAAFSSDIASGHAKLASSSPSASEPSSSAGPSLAPKQKTTQTPSAHIKPSAQKIAAPLAPVASFADYSTAESLGFADPDIERAQEEAARRQTMGVVGDWQIVESMPTPHRPLSSTLTADGQGEGRVNEEEGVKVEEGISFAARQKRPADAEEDERGWKLQRKTVAVGLGEIYDPGIIVIKPRVKAEDVIPDAAIVNGGVAKPGVLGGDIPGAMPATLDEPGPQATALPKWAPTRWKKSGEILVASSSLPSTSSSSAMALDKGSIEVPTSAEAPSETLEESSKVANLVKAEEALAVTSSASEEPAPSLFKKRRPPTGGGSRGRRG
jgi:WW domain-binding protein 4